MKYVVIRVIPEEVSEEGLREFCEAASRDLLARGAVAVAPRVFEGEPDLVRFMEADE